MAEVDYASNAKANTAVTLGSVALGVAGLQALRNKITAAAEITAVF